MYWVLLSPFWYIADNTGYNSLFSSFAWRNTPQNLLKLLTIWSLNMVLFIIPKQWFLLFLFSFLILFSFSISMGVQSFRSLRHNVYAGTKTKKPSNIPMAKLDLFINQPWWSWSGSISFVPYDVTNILYFLIEYTSFYLENLNTYLSKSLKYELLPVRLFNRSFDKIY